MGMFQLMLLLYFMPILVAYLAICLLSPLLRFGKEEPGKGVKFHIARDMIHSDYLFESKLWKDMFPPKDKYVKIGWGDRKIFLETKTWGDLKTEDFLTAFFGLNRTVLKVQFVAEIPDGSKPMEIDERQLAVIKEHVRCSFKGEPIKKRPTHCQTGDYYESDLKYNCFTNCNNWVNYGLYLGRATNRIWCPFSFWV
ncbi:DUF2459 domain-containing protein [bacterium]|nr:DUF2459 domain-containing protein [bacterium]